jgi:hypothetical protein
VPAQSEIIMQQPSELNPLTIIFGVGVGVINVLGGLVLTMALAQLKQIRTDVKLAIGHFNGDDGIFTRLQRIEGDIRTNIAEIGALKLGTMNKELLIEKLETIKGQNTKLEEQAKELYVQQRETFGKVTQLERNTRSGGWPASPNERK